MCSLLVALGRIIIPYRLISLIIGMVLAAFYQTEAATITAEGVSLADGLDVRGGGSLPVGRLDPHPGYERQ